MAKQISVLRACRLALVAMLRAERRRQQEREAEARYWSFLEWDTPEEDEAWAYLSNQG